MRLAILSHYGDVHAEAVAWAVRQCGAQCGIIRPSDVPTYLSAAIALDNQGFKLQDEAGSLLNNETIFWNRRRGRFSPDGRRPEADNAYVAYESRQWLHGVYLVLTQPRSFRHSFGESVRLSFWFMGGGQGPLSGAVA